jgi:lysophospholipase
MKLISLLTLLLSANSWAISESNYKEDYNALIKPFISQMHGDDFISNNAKIHYSSFTNPNNKACVFISPGRTESGLKYAEFIYDLSHTEFGSTLNYFVIDHRGQGLSQRLTKTYDVGYVDHFKYYVSDFKRFIEVVDSQYHCSEKFLFAHSMGAGIALKYITENPTTFKAQAISSPMLKIQTDPYPYFVARTIVTTLTLAHKGADFAIGQKGYNPNDAFEDNKFTSSKERFDMSMAIFKDYPDSRLGGVSNKWLLEIMNGTIKLRRDYAKITAPMIVFKAGVEKYSEPDEMTKLCLEARDCHEFMFYDSKHEVFNDQDHTREKVLASILELFKNNL